MMCPKCKSENVSIQVVNEVKLKNKHHGLLWWLIIGWWWFPIKWLVFGGWALFALLFIPKKQKAKNIKKTMCVCQSCGHSWEK